MGDLWDNIKADSVKQSSFRVTGVLEEEEEEKYLKK